MATPEGWTESGGALTREFRFADFTEAWGFMSRVALIAEKRDHHPDWSNSWNTVSISLTTHSAGSTVTENDVAMAEAINQVLGG